MIFNTRISRVTSLVALAVFTFSFSAIGVAQDDTVASAKTPVNQVNLESIFSGKSDPQSIDDLRAFQNHVRDLAERVKKATVNIQVGMAQGSGVIVSRDGLVLTAAHVIGKPGLPAVVKMPDGTEYKAKTKGLVHGIDSGMLKITDNGKWDYLDIGQSAPIEKGQWVMAIGHPGGWDEDGRGLVVRLGRVLAATSRVLRTDCTLVGGDSGGPLVDMSGNVIGIHSRIGGNLSQNMHVPIDVFSDGWEDLESDVEKGGSRRRGEPYLGFTLGAEDTMAIADVKKDGPADKAGIKAGDVVVELGGVKVTNRMQLQAAFFRLSVDQEVDIVVKRDGKELKLKIKVGKRN